MPKTPSLQLKTLPKDVDAQILRTIRGDKKRHSFQLPDFTVYWRLSFSVVVCAILVFWHDTRTSYAQSEIWATIAADSLRAQLNAQNVISYDRYLLTEGQDKTAYIAKAHNLSHEELVNIPQRQDIVEQWSHSITTRIEARKNIDHNPYHVALNFENDNHLHLFTNIQKKCAKNDIHCGTHKLSHENAAHRALYDQTHNLSSDYDHHTDPALTKSFASLPHMELSHENRESYIFREQLSDDIRIEHYYTKADLIKTKEVTFTRLDETWYEMAVKSHLTHDHIAADKFEDIFSPQDLSQVGIIELSAR